MRTHQYKMRWYIVLLAAFIFVVHSSYIFNGFVWLDHGDIEGGRALGTSFFHRFGDTSFYRPLVSVFHVFDSTIYGSWAPGFHITNIVLHVATSIAAPLFISVFFPLSVVEFLIVMLVVGVHPLSWLPVGAISYRQELMVSFFTYVSIYFHTRARIKGRAILYSLTIVAILLALFSKETAVFWIPSYIVLWELWWSKHKHPNTDNRSAFVIAECFAIAFYMLMRVYAVPEIWRTARPPMSALQAISTRLYVLGNAIVNLILPLKPALSDAISTVTTVQTYSIIAICVLIICLYYIRRYTAFKNGSYALLILGVALLPALNIVPLPRFNSPHYAYVALPVLGIFWVFILRIKKWHNATRMAYGLWIIVAIISTYIAGARFRDDVTLFKPEVTRDSQFLEGQYYLGTYYWQHADYNTAQKYFNAAMPDDRYIAYVDRSALYINYGGLLLAQNRLPEAETYLKRALAYSSSSVKPLIVYDLALIAARQHDYEKVVSLLNQSSTRWNRAEPYLLLASALYKIGRKEQAVKVLQDAMPMFSKTQREQVRKLIESESTEQIQK